LISGEYTLAAEKQSFPQNRLGHFDKALRRGRKFERTLLKIIAQSEPGSEVESLLKSVQQGLKVLKKEIKKPERSPTSNTKKPLARRKAASKAITPSEMSSKPVRRSRKKEPIRADLSSGENQSMPETGK
jgi:hypothetical protein